MGGGSTTQTTQQQSTQSKDYPYWTYQAPENVIKTTRALSAQPYTPFGYAYQPKGTTWPYGYNYVYAGEGDSGYINYGPEGISYKNKDMGGTGSPTSQQAGYRDIFSGEFIPFGEELPYKSMSAPMNEYQTQGLQGILGAAQGNIDVSEASQDTLRKILGGEFLNAEANPYLQSAYKSAASNITDEFQKATMPGLNAAASRAGAFGGSTHALLQGEAQKGLAQELGDLGNQMYYQNYNDQMSNLVKSMMFAPDAYQPYSVTAGVGDVYQTQDQQQLNEQYQQWQDMMNYPYEVQAMMAGTIPSVAGQMGTTTGSSYGTTTGTQTSNPLGSIIGGVGAGLSALTSPMSSTSMLSKLLGSWF